MCSGPAKGYLSDLELKLHQMEALIGVLLGSRDPRASSLISDISQDSVAREILNRVDVSLLGTHPLDQPLNSDPRVGNSSVGKRISTELADSTHEWQRHLAQIIGRNSSLGGDGVGRQTFARENNSIKTRSSVLLIYIFRSYRLDKQFSLPVSPVDDVRHVLENFTPTALKSTG